MISGPLHAVDGSPLYEDPAEVRSTDRPCALDICNTARSFTHESNTCVIRRRAFLILGCIDLLSYTPPPATLLLTIFGRPDFVQDYFEQLSAFTDDLE